MDKILTLNHLQSRGWNFANRCILCKQEEESVSHIFIHCSMAKLVWDFFLSHLQISWVFPKFINALIMGWWISGLGSFPVSIWHVLPGAICLGMWRERNCRIFEDKFRSHSKFLLLWFHLPNDPSLLYLLYFVIFNK